MVGSPNLVSRFLQLTHFIFHFATRLTKPEICELHIGLIYMKNHGDSFPSVGSPKINDPLLVVESET